MLSVVPLASVSELCGASPLSLSDLLDCSRLASPASASASGATYVVDQASGSDSAPGSEAKPFKTVARGAKALAAGDTLIIKAGVYRESVAVTAMGGQFANKNGSRLSYFPGQAGVEGLLKNLSQ